MTRGQRDSLHHTSQVSLHLGFSIGFGHVINSSLPRQNLLRVTSNPRGDLSRGGSDGVDLPCEWAGARVARAVGGTWSVLFVGGSSSMTVGGGHGSLRPRPPWLLSPAAGESSPPPTGCNPPAASAAALIPLPPFLCSLLSLPMPKSVGSEASFLLLLLPLWCGTLVPLLSHGAVPLPHCCLLHGAADPLPLLLLPQPPRWVTTTMTRHTNCSSSSSRLRRRRRRRACARVTHCSR